MEALATKLAGRDVPYFDIRARFNEGAVISELESLSSRLAGRDAPALDLTAGFLPAQAAVVGVYGRRCIGLGLLVARVLSGQGAWRERPLAIAFWGMNLGLGLMVRLSLLPVGLAQGYASVETGLWYARSAEFLQQPWLQTLRWLRMVGDTVFLVGAGALIWFLLGLVTGWSYRARAESPDSVAGAAAPRPEHA